MSSKTGVAPSGESDGGDSPRERKTEPSISLSQHGSRLSQTVIASVEQLRTLLDLMIDERVAELLEERNRLPRFGQDTRLGFENIDRLLSEYTGRKIQSWKLIDKVARELMRYEIERREHRGLPFPGSGD